jgi:pSer/pThr/pTyr-binding forkhead associated (FHA) protein
MAQESFQLVMRKGPTPGNKYLLNKPEIIIGRESNNDIIINEVEVSRKHARLLRKAGGYVVEDMGSTNGTFVNGQRLIGPHSLQPGEVILLADTISFNYEVAQPDSKAAYHAGAGERPSESRPAPVTVVEAPREEQDINRSRQENLDYYTEPEEEPFIADYGYQEEEPDEKRPRPLQSWILAGCGCFIVVLCALVAVFLVLDQMNQLCNPLIRPVTNLILSIINPILGTTYYCP